IHGSPPIGLLFVLAGVAAAGSAIDRPSRAAILPNLGDHTRLRSAISFNYGLWQLTGVVGPALGGAIIAVLGLDWAYGIDVATFVAMVVSVWFIHPQQTPTAEG